MGLQPLSPVVAYKIADVVTFSPAAQTSKSERRTRFDKRVNIRTCVEEVGKGLLYKSAPLH